MCCCYPWVFFFLFFYIPWCTCIGIVNNHIEQLRGLQAEINCLICFGTLQISAPHSCWSSNRSVHCFRTFVWLWVKKKNHVCFTKPFKEMNKSHWISSHGKYFYSSDRNRHYRMLSFSTGLHFNLSLYFHFICFDCFLCSFHYILSLSFSLPFFFRLWKWTIRWCQQRRSVTCQEDFFFLQDNKTRHQRFKNRRR